MTLTHFVLYGCDGNPYAFDPAHAGDLYDMFVGSEDPRVFADLDQDLETQVLEQLDAHHYDFAALAEDLEIEFGDDDDDVDDMIKSLFDDLVDKLVGYIAENL